MAENGNKHLETTGNQTRCYLSIHAEPGVSCALDYLIPTHPIHSRREALSSSSFYKDPPQPLTCREWGQIQRQLSEHLRGPPSRVPAPPSTAQVLVGGFSLTAAWDSHPLSLLPPPTLSSAAQAAPAQAPVAYHRHFPCPTPTLKNRKQSHSQPTSCI